MNLPERFELFELPEGAAKVHMEIDNKSEQTIATFFLEREDHTLGNLLRSQLLADADVVFAGYRIPHPLSPMVEIRVMTRDQKSPKAVFIKALNDILGQLDSFYDHFQMEASRARIDPKRFTGLRTTTEEMDFV